MAIAIPAPLVTDNQGTPRVCVRHGEPADRHKRVVFRSKAPGWSYLLILGGVILFAIVTAVIQKRIKSPAWPFCPRCAALRLRRILTGVGLVILSVVLVVVLTAVIPEDSSFGVVAILGFVAVLLAGLLFIALSGWMAIANGFATRDGGAVEFRDPAPRFVEEAAPAQQWALQQRAAQDAASRQWADQYQQRR